MGQVKRGGAAAGVRILAATLVLIAASGLSVVAQQPANPPPLPNRVNEAMPSWLRLRAEFRERMEGFDGAGYVEGRDDLYWLTRLRLNATITPRPLLSFQFQVQDARVAKKQVGPVGAPFQGPFDLRMAFADVGSAGTPVVVRVGRQELAFGEQRLVGHVGWLNTARTFDGARATLRHARFNVDAFATSVVRILDGSFDKSGNGNWFTGAYATTTALVPKSSVEPFVFWRRDTNLRGESGTFGALNQTTAGVRWAGTAAGASRLLDRDGRAIRLARHRFRARLGGTLAAAPIARRSRRRSASPPSTTSLRAMPTLATAGEARSTSSIPHPTTSTGSPIKWRGATSTTCASAPSSCRAGKSR